MRPPDMLLNAIFEEQGMMSIAVEIQVHHEEILRLKTNKHHLLYEIIRAPSISVLREKAANDTVRWEAQRLLDEAPVEHMAAIEAEGSTAGASRKLSSAAASLPGVSFEPGAGEQSRTPEGERPKIVPAVQPQGFGHLVHQSSVPLSSAHRWGSLEDPESSTSLPLRLPVESPSWSSGVASEVKAAAGPAADFPTIDFLTNTDIHQHVMHVAVEGVAQMITKRGYMKAVGSTGSPSTRSSICSRGRPRPGRRPRPVWGRR